MRWVCWQGQNDFFDICLTNVIANSQKHQNIETILEKHKKEKTRGFNNRNMTCDMTVEHGTFTTLVFLVVKLQKRLCSISILHKRLPEKPKRITAEYFRVSPTDV